MIFYIDLFVIVVFLLFVLVYLVVLVVLIVGNVFIVEFPGLYCVVFLVHLMEIVFLDC